MRQIGTLGNLKQAKRFADYLLTLGITTQVDPSGEGAVIWVRDEDHLPQAQKEFGRFRKAPDDAKYRVGREAERIRSEADAYAKRFQKNQIDVRRRWGTGMASRRGPLTLALIGISIAVTLMSNFGKVESPVTLACIISKQVFPADAPWDVRLPEIRQGQVWRLVTPIFLHFSTLHIIFNMLWLLDLGNQIESRRGAVRLAAIVAAIAIISNLAQYFTSGYPLFGGMSGVVFGLFGYIWMRARYSPGSGFVLTQNTVFWMIGWLIFCFTGFAGPIANAAHAVGLAVGIAIGIAPRLWRR